MSSLDTCFFTTKFDALTNRDTEITRLFKNNISKQEYDFDQDFYICSLPKLLLLIGSSSNCIIQFATYYLHYKKKPEIIRLTYDIFFEPLFKLLLLTNALSDYVFKVIATYSPCYKNKLVNNLT